MEETYGRGDCPHSGLCTDFGVAQLEAILCRCDHRPFFISVILSGIRWQDNHHHVLLSRLKGK